MYIYKKDIDNLQLCKKGKELYMYGIIPFANKVWFIYIYIYISHKQITYKYYTYTQKIFGRI